MQHDDTLVFDVLLITDDGESPADLVDAFRQDPHLRVFVAASDAADVVLESLHAVDLVVASGSDPAAGATLEVIRDRTPPTAIVVYRSRGDMEVFATADAVVMSRDPGLILLTARWLLGLPSRVVPARRNALRRMVRQ